MSTSGSTSDQHEFVSRLRETIVSYLGGQLDVEDRTPVDLLIANVNASPDQKDDWAAALVELAREIQPEQSSWWRPLEFIATFGDMSSQRLGEVLESVLARGVCLDPMGRAGIYALLAELGKTPTAKTLWEDQALKEAAPLAWLDLILPLIPDLETRQKLIVDAVRAKEFKVENFDQRQDDMRSVGGRNLGDWLIALRDEFPSDERLQFDTIVHEAFGLTLNANAKDVSIGPSNPLGRGTLRETRPISRLLERLARVKPRRRPSHTAQAA